MKKEDFKRMHITPPPKKNKVICIYKICSYKRNWFYQTSVWIWFHNLKQFWVITIPRWSRDQTEKQKPSQPHLSNIPHEIDFPNPWNFLLPDYIYMYMCFLTSCGFIFRIAYTNFTGLAFSNCIVFLKKINV